MREGEHIRIEVSWDDISISLKVVVPRELNKSSVIVMPGPVAVFCMVYHYTKRATLTRLLGNVGPAIYVVLLNKYFVILLVLIQ